MIFSFNSCSLILRPVSLWSNGELKYSLTEEFVNSAQNYLQEAEKTTLDGKGIMAINSAWSKFIESYYYVATQVNIAYVRYNANMSNKTYKEEYLFASTAYQNLYAGYTATLRKIYNSPKKDMFFADWTEEEINNIVNYDDELKNLNLKDEALNVEYSEIPESEFYTKSIEVYKKVVENNNLIGNKWGYDNYYDYATEKVYERDFDKNQREVFRDNVRDDVVEVLQSASKKLLSAEKALTKEEKDQANSILYGDYDLTGKNNLYEKYVNSYNGTTHSAFSHAFRNNNVLFSDSDVSNDAAFTAYFDYYDVPFCYFGPGYQSSFTIAHEIGHYYSNLYEKNRHVSMDLSEVFSQANEMLLLGFAEEQLSNPVFEYIELKNLTESLNAVVTCVMVDEFEETVYSTDVAYYSSNDFDAIMNNICDKYYGSEVSNIANLKNSMNKYWRKVVVRQPVYYLSYSVSGLASVLFYSDVKENESSAREKYRRLIENAPVASGFTASLRNAGFTTPFDNNAFDKIALIFE